MIERLARLASPHRLTPSGVVPVRLEDGLPADIRSLVLLSPAEPGFWAHVTSQPEFTDGRPDPLDRWSRRAIGRMACALGAKAYFPFTGPPFRPFTDWTLRSGETFSSPVRLFVHARMGLFASWRGAIGLREALVPDDAAPNPCSACAQPCTTACPVGALTPAGYDTARCRSHLRSPAGTDCRKGGCLVRRSCPVSAGYGRLAAQSAFHMARFLENE